MNTLPPSRPPAAQAQSPRPMPGAGVLLTANDFGFAHSVPRRGSSFNHAFKCFLGAGVLQVSHGLVDGIYTPKIGDKRISEPNVSLKLNAKKVNEAGESWAVLEVEPNDKNVLDAKSRIEIVQLAEVDLHHPKIGRHVIVLILFKKGTPWRLVANATFNVNYKRVVPQPGGGLVAHYFT